MKRIVFWGLSTLSATVLLFGYSTSTSGPLATTSATSFVSGASAGNGATPSTGASTGDGATPSTGTDPSAPAASSAPAATPASITATGSVAQTRWGPVQVELTLEGGTVTDVAVLQYPNGNGRDVEINNVALPRLIQETLDAQSAQIDMVSGATYTSEGYLESLQSALDQAGV